MFSVGNSVEFYFEDFGQRVYVHGDITRVNELGCFVALTHIESYDNSLVRGGRTYRVGDEMYVLNSALNLGSSSDHEVPQEKHLKISWLWLIVFIILITLLIINWVE